MPVAGSDARGARLYDRCRMARWRPKAHFRHFCTSSATRPICELPERVPTQLPQKWRQFCFSLKRWETKGSTNWHIERREPLTEMVDEPYKSAVARIADHPIWKNTHHRPGPKERAFNLGPWAR